MEAELGCDPLQRLFDGVFVEVLSRLDAATLGRCLCVSSNWNHLCQSDFLWTKHCLELWKDKSIVIHGTKPEDPLQPSIRAYRLSLEEGRRTQIEVDDLCFYSWNFWYKQTAGEYWVECDPYWRGNEPMKRYFHRDGYISADEDDPLWGGHECRWRILRSSNSSSCVRVNQWPPLTVSRTSSWAWRMENFMVVYESSLFRCEHKRI